MTTPTQRPRRTRYQGTGRRQAGKERAGRHRIRRPPVPRHPLRRHRTVTTITVLAVAGSAMVATSMVAAAPLVKPDPNGWTTVWSDGFDGPPGTPPSPADWIIDTGTQYPGGAPQWGTGEVQTYTTDPRNVALDGRGHLKITATRTAWGAWRSGRLETRRADFQPPAGGRLKVVGRIRLPAGGPGYWSAFWMLGAPFRPSHTNWPGAGEIDVMENIGSEPSLVHGTLHCGVFGGGPCRETTGLGAERLAAMGAYTRGFHTYSMIWDRSAPVEELRWYVDGHRYHTVRASDVDRDTWVRTTGHGYFILLNVAIGGSWPGPPGASTRPGASMLVDRVTVSRQG